MNKHTVLLLHPGIGVLDGDEDVKRESDENVEAQEHCDDEPVEEGGKGLNGRCEMVQLVQLQVFRERKR